LETDLDKLQLLIEQTERAIAERYRTLGPFPDADEVQRMASAAWNLSVLRREVKGQAKAS
jgi:hypothetical protein